jgi:ADP-ribose pyrophosphatase YjhB (NUDIX family)
MTKDSHCSFCGNRFSDDAPWPRRCLNCGNSTYRNPLPVAVVLLPMAGGVVVIRRNTEPSKGTLTLAGGYIDLGETWQEGAQRELLEETGIEIDRNDLLLYDVQNGLDKTLVIFGLAKEMPLNALKPFTSNETQEVTLIDRPIELGFPLHTEVVKRFFTEKWAVKKGG